MAPWSFLLCCTSLRCFWRQRTRLYRQTQVRKIKIGYWMPFIFTVVSLIKSNGIFCNPCFDKIASKVATVSLPSLGGSKVPFRKACRSFRHSRVTPGGWLLMLDTARLHSMTQSHSAVFSFLKLWEKTFPCPAAILNTRKGTTWIAKCFFSHCLLLLMSQTVEPRNVSKMEMKADDFRAEVKFSGRISLLGQAAFITCIATPRLA